MFERKRIAMSCFLLVMLLAGSVRAAEVAFVVGSILEPEGVNEGDVLPTGTVVQAGDDALVMVEHRWPSDIPSRDCILIAIFGYGQSYTVGESETPGRCQTTVPTNPGALQAGQPFLNRETRYGDAKFDEPTVPDKVARSEGQWMAFNQWVRNAQRSFTGVVTSVSGVRIRLRSPSSNKQRAFSVKPSTIISSDLDTLTGQSVRVDYRMSSVGPEAVRIELTSESSKKEVSDSVVMRPPDRIRDLIERPDVDEKPTGRGDPGKIADPPADRWTCTLDLHQGDSGTLDFNREEGKVEGSITVRSGSQTHSISGTWKGERIQFWRALSDTSGQPFVGIVIQSGDGPALMAGRFANRLSGVWSADCTPALNQDSESGSPSSGLVDVLLTSAGDDKIAVIKTVREITGLGLKDAKDLVDRVPATIQAGVSIGEARRLANALRNAGATVSVVARQ